MVLLALARSIALYGITIALDAVRRAAMTMVGYVVAGMLLLVSLAFLTLATYRAISQSLNDVYAALIVGSAYLVLALVAMIVLYARRR
jgi:uncharacterized membrane protein